MNIKDVCVYLESIAPLALQESYDNSGLIVGNENNPVTGILITLDSTEAVIQEAIDKNCNLVIAHHPIVFSGLKKITGKNYIERTVIKAIQHDVAIYAAHTNMDNIAGGVNEMIAQKLELENVRVLAPKGSSLKKLVTYCPLEKADAVREALFHAGAGHIGNYDSCSFNLEGTGTFRASAMAQPYVGEIGALHTEKEIRIETVYPFYLEKSILSALFKAHPYEEVAYDIYVLDNKNALVGSGAIGELKAAMPIQDFLKMIKNVFHAGAIRYTRPVTDMVKTIAVCGGSGSFLLSDAIKSGADVFVTADFKYHQFFDAEDKIVIADTGHFENEQFTKELFYEFLKKKNYTFAVHLSKVDTNPINYI